MADIVISDNGIFQKMTAYASNLSFRTLEIRLFANNITPDRDTVEADFVDPTYTGYAAQNPNFPGSVSVTSHVASFAMQDTTFVSGGNTGSELIYGYRCYNVTTGFMEWSCRFDTPVDMNAIGQTIVVHITLDDESMFP